MVEESSVVQVQVRLFGGCKVMNLGNKRACYAKDGR